MSENIFQIYHNKSLVPKYICKYIQDINPNYNYLFLDFEEGKEMIKKDLGNNELANIICKKLNSMPRYCHKSDLLRYCLLYMYGGVYIDIDLQPLVSFDKLIPNNVNFFTSIGGGPNPYIVNNNKIHCCMANGILYSNKNNTILMDLIQNILNNINLVNKNPKFRGDNVYYLFNYLKNICNRNNILFEPFKIMKIYDQNVYLLNTIPQFIKNMGINCIVNNKTVVINPNNPKYIIQRQSSSNI